MTMEYNDEQALDNLLKSGMSEMGQAKSAERASIAAMVEYHIKAQQKHSRLRPWLVGGCLLLGFAIGFPSVLTLLSEMGSVVAQAEVPRPEFQLAMLRDLPVLLLLLALAGPAAVWLSEAS